MGSSLFNMRSILALFLLVVQLATALKFDLPATSGHGKNERCIRNLVSKDQLVVVTAIVSGQKGDGQKVNMHVRVNWCFGEEHSRPWIYWAAIIALLPQTRDN